jgi:hypothetical protein
MHDGACSLGPVSAQGEENNDLSLGIVLAALHEQATRVVGHGQACRVRHLWRMPGRGSPCSDVCATLKFKRAVEPQRHDGTHLHPLPGRLHATAVRGDKDVGDRVLPRCAHHGRCTFGHMHHVCAPSACPRAEDAPQREEAEPRPRLVL